MAFIEGKPQQGLGDILGGQLQKALGTIGQAKLQQMMQRQQLSDRQANLEQGLKQIPGAKPEWAQVINAFPPEKSVDVLRELMRGGNVEQPQTGTAQVAGQPGQPNVQQAQQSNIPARKPFETSQETMEREKEAGKERRHAQDISVQDQRDIDRQTEKDYETIKNQYRSGRTQKMELQRLLKLEENGKLPDEKLFSLMKHFGLDIPALMTADAQEAQKLTTGFLKNMKDMFGARILETEVENFIKTIPSLMQTPEGRKRVINNMLAVVDAGEIRFNTMRELKKENNGRRPRDMAELIEEKASPKLDALAERFKSGYGQTFDQMPSPEQNSGRQIEDDNTGKKYMSDGKTWREM